MFSLQNMWFISIFLFIFGHIFSSAVEGGTGVASTQLTAAIDISATTVPVVTTAGFLATTGQTILIIGNEEMDYTGFTATTFTGVTRGTNGSDTTAHASSTRVYNAVAGRVNQLVAFEVAEAESAIGKLRVLTQITGAVLGAIPSLIMWDYSFFTGDWIYLKFFLYAISTTMILGFVVQIGAPALNGLFRR